MASFVNSPEWMSLLRPAARGLQTLSPWRASKLYQEHAARIAQSAAATSEKDAWRHVRDSIKRVNVSPEKRVWRMGGSYAMHEANCLRDGKCTEAEAWKRACRRL
ncbi:MAG: hypothetical protein SGPRY_005749 [Prymnesium sp.]